MSRKKKGLTENQLHKIGTIFSNARKMYEKKYSSSVQKINVEPRNVITFKASNKLKEKVNFGSSESFRKNLDS